MYLLVENKSALLIDASCEKKVIDKEIPEECCIDYILLTHEHYDHVAYLNELRAYPGAKVVGSLACAKAIALPSRNLARYYNMLLELTPYNNRIDLEKVDIKFSAQIDIMFDKRLRILWQGHNIDFYACPGHSAGSTCILIDNTFLFSGDTIIPNTKTFTKLPGGSRKDYLQTKKEYLDYLPKDIEVFPGHLNSFILSTCYEYFA